MMSRDGTTTSLGLVSDSCSLFDISVLLYGVFAARGNSKYLDLFHYLYSALGLAVGAKRRMSVVMEEGIFLMIRFFIVQKEM